MGPGSIARRWIDKIKTRTLRVDILTLFLSLFVISFAFVIFFTYFQGKKSIDSFALGTVSRASNTVLEKTKAMIQDAEQLPMIIDSVIWKEQDISCNNEDLILF